jgi:hypothetical protein
VCVGGGMVEWGLGHCSFLNLLDAGVRLCVYALPAVATDVPAAASLYLFLYKHVRRARKSCARQLCKVCL